MTDEGERTPVISVLRAGYERAMTDAADTPNRSPEKPTAPTRNSTWVWHNDT